MTALAPRLNSEIQALPTHGGARAGAGRKKKTTAEQQAARRDAVIAALPPVLLKRVVQLDLEAALGGETARIDRWLPYVLGSPRAELALGVGAAEVRIVIETVDDRPDSDAHADR